MCICYYTNINTAATQGKPVGGGLRGRDEETRAPPSDVI